MKEKCKHRGFSLTEVLMAVGILAVGMVFVAGVFPVAIHFTTIAAERTTAAVVADEAFAKIRLYAMGDPANPVDDIDPTGLPFDQQTPVELVPLKSGAFIVIDPDEFAYPSTPPAYTGVTQKQYYWSALCRRVDLSPANRGVQVTVFVSRKIGAGTMYVGGLPRPIPSQVEVSQLGANELQITDGNKTFINDGYTIVDDVTGQIYRVLERYSDNDTVVLLDRPWDGGTTWPHFVWVVPPPVGGGRGPCIAVYQKVIQF